jgi:tetratricopeptide (TPR) repeat protein
LAQGGYSLSSIYCACLAAANETQSYEQAVETAYAYAAHTNDSGALATLLDAATLQPNPTMSRNALLRIVEDLEEPTKSWVRRYKGRAFLRADELQQAIDWLATHDLVKGVGPLCVVALAHHELGHETQAKEFLQKAKDDVLSQMADRRTPSYHGHALLVEAHERITGTSLAEDPDWVSLREEIETQLAEMPAETADYDLALILEPQQPHLWVARAQRHADLERWEDAEQDIAEAIRLDENNVGTWLAVARYWAHRGNLDEARDAYDQVLRLDSDSTYRQQALEDLKRHVPLLMALLEIRDDDSDLWDACGAQLHEERRWSEAVAAWQRRAEKESANPIIGYQLALLQIAAGDTSGYASTCRNLLDRHAQDQIEGPTFLASWACGLGPEACDDYTPAIEFAERCRNHSPVDASIRITLGAALVRGGRIAEAIAELEEGALLAVCEDDRSGTPPAYAWYLLAIANKQAGNHAAAQRWHEQARRWTRDQIEIASPRLERWNRRLTLELLERESEMLLKQAARS